MEDKREDYQNCFVLYCVPQLYPIVWFVIGFSSFVFFVIIWFLSLSVAAQSIALKESSGTLNKNLVTYSCDSIKAAC